MKTGTGKNIGFPEHCAMCNYEASLKGNLTKHIDAVHDGKKPFSCDICGMSFKQKQGLERHIPLVHEGIKPFQCEIWERKLSTKGGLNKHIKKEHSDDTKDTEIIVKQEFSEFKEEPIGIYRKYSDYENFISVDEIKPEAI